MTHLELRKRYNEIASHVASNTPPDETYSEEEIQYYNKLKAEFELVKQSHPDAELVLENFDEN